MDVKKYTKDQLKAAYALNLCTVSISQIIDYNDLNIMEQEYETILNNLNLEHMPKDDALLKILVQLLDTITYFRIQEGEKRLIDKEYQHQIKNAIWSAVPNFGLIVAGGNPLNMAISLASQVGIGYMNYRRAKSDLSIENDRKHWEIERTAMEQFNGLRRELFDTAWRLAAVYNFPDELRLTERQIKQYNEILIDSNEIRKYERLNTIKEDFVAYPPFWYQLGSTANRISQYEFLSLEARSQYKCEALDAFINYWKSNEFPLLRNDYLASSCALEQIELLNINNDMDTIKLLLEKAIKYSGRSNDILQLCAIQYLKIGEKEQATNLLRTLVNEEYNLPLNAQLLSCLYIKDMYSGEPKKIDNARARYELLYARVNPDYLLKMPSKGSNISEIEVHEEFHERQETLLNRKFDAVIQTYMDTFLIRLGKLIPPVKEQEDLPDFYYSKEGIEQRFKDIDSLFKTSFKHKQRQSYLDILSRSAFIVNYFDALNCFFDEITELNCLRDRNKLKDIISEKIEENAFSINSLTQKIDSRQIDVDDIYKLLELVSYSMFENFVTELKNQINITILGMNNIEKLMQADSALRNFCIKHNISEPDLLIEETKNAKSDFGLTPTYFGYDLLGEAGENYQKERSHYKTVETIIRNYIAAYSSEKGNETIYFHDSSEYNRYIENSKFGRHKDMLLKTIAIYDDKSKANVDILFTSEGLVPVIKNKVRENISYLSVASEDILKQINAIRCGTIDTSVVSLAKRSILLGAISPIIPLSVAAKESYEMNCVFSIVKKYQAMIDQIAKEIIKE